MITLPLSSIIIDRPARQRRNLQSIEELAASIARTGLIQPPVVTRENVLVAGERRITAMRSLGWTDTPVNFTDELDPAQLQLIELEENVQRVDLAWQDEVCAVQAYHNLRAEMEPDWSAKATARALGRSEALIGNFLSLAREIRAGNQLVIDAQNKSVAVNMMARLSERRAAAQREALLAANLKDHTNEESSAEDQEFLEGAGRDSTTTHVPSMQLRRLSSPSGPILNLDFTQWAPTYTGPPFNFLHCDFPYGINADKRKQGTSVAKHGGYRDDPETYWRLLGTLANEIDRLASPSAHILFWFSMDYYTETIRFLTSYMPDWIFQPFPVYWSKSDNAGLLPDPKRGPRRVVETALIGTRGDRLLVQSVSNHFPSPTVRDGHISIKPVPVLSHFFRMFVDENTSILDPTCGAGSSLVAAKLAGATRLLGLEINPDFAALATSRYEEATRGS